jgi:serine/threonine-protein kinase
VYDGRVGSETAPTGTPKSSYPSVPSDPVAAREFLQSRVSIYIAVALSIWSIAFLCDRVINAITETGHNGWYTYAHFSAIGLLAVFFLITRRGRCSTPALRVMEVSATLVQAVLGAILFGQLPLAVRPEMLALFGTNLFLLLRAGIVPGTTLGGFWVGVVSVLPANVLTYWLYSTQPPVPNGTDLTSGMLYVAEWSAMTIGATTAIHSVIYGLRARVQELGQYTLLHKIGEGGMGVVYRAQHALLRRPTAVKVLSAARTTTIGVARFEREVQLTAELAHPNIVSVYDFGRTPDGSFYYAMELLDGVDLQRLVEEDGPIPPARAVHLLRQAADALAEAHEVGLIHRDIKPANLLVANRARRPDHLTVLDFGLAKEVSSIDAQLQDVQLSGTQELTGTPLYMSPEAIREPKLVDGRSDVYALGAVAYWMLTGSAPFTGRTIVEVCAAHLHKEVEPPSQRIGRALPADLEALVVQCLAKEQAARPDGAVALLERLRAIDAGEWTHAQARQCWKVREARPAPPRAPETIEYARTLAIARRERKAPADG